MNPNEYALMLKKTHGLDKALMISEGHATVTTQLTTLEDVPAYSDEIEYSMEEYKGKGGAVRSREKIKIDKVTQAKRLKKAAAFWVNVVGVLRREKRKMATTKVA